MVFPLSFAWGNLGARFAYGFHNVLSASKLRSEVPGSYVGTSPRVPPLHLKYEVACSAGADQPDRGRSCWQ